MKGPTFWYIFLSFSCAYASPYYYRESKHQAEHHQEYSYGGHDGPGQLPESYHQDAMLVPSLSVSPKPERYSLYMSTPQVSSYSQGQEGSYSFSHGALQGASLYQSPTSYSVSKQEVVQPSAPVVVTRRIVRVYGHPATSTQSEYFQIRNAGQGDRLHSASGHTGGTYFQGGQREVSLESSRDSHSLYGKHVNEEVESGQREVSEEFGEQRPYRDDIFTQEKVGILHSKPTIMPYIPSVSSQRVERRYESQHSSKVDYGQQEEPLHGFTHGEHYGRQGSLYANHGSLNLESGQLEEPIPSSLEVGQKEETLEVSQKQLGSHGSLYQSHELELGQKEEPLFGQETTDLGQKEESLLWQNEKKERLHHTLYSKSEVTGNEKPVQGLQLVQHQKSLYQNENQQLELGQKEEALSGQEPDDLGQKEEKESIYHGKYSSSEIGQKEEPSQGFQLMGHPENLGSLYQNHESHHLELGQKEEPFFPHGQAPDDLGQKVENLGQTEEKESFHHSKYSSSEIGQKEEPLQGIHVQYHGSHYQNHESQLELGQKEEALSGQEPADLGQKEELLIGQEEENLGQVEEKEGLRNGKYGSLEVGQKQEHLEGSTSVSKYEKHVHKNQKEVVVTKPSQHYFGQRGDLQELDVGQKEESLDEIGQVEEKEQFSPRGDLQLGKKQESDSDSFPHTYGHHTHKDEAHGHHHGMSWQQRKSCTHGEHYQHGGFGKGQFGHDQEMFNSREKEVVNVFSEDKLKPGSPVNTSPSLTGGNSGRQGVTYSSIIRESSHSRQEIQKSNPGSQVTKVSGESNRQHIGNNVDINKLVEALASQLEREGFSAKSKPIFEDTNTQTTKSTQNSTPSVVHNADIQELGTEVFNTQSNIQSRVIAGVPQRRVNVYETQKEEYGYGPSSQRTYSKKHSRHYSVKEESHSVSLPQPVEESANLLGQSRSAQQQSAGGGWYGFSQQSSSAGQGDAHLHRVIRDRHSDIDSFLTELDKDIARDNKKPAQGGYVPVTTQQRTPSHSGSSYFSESSYTSKTEHSSGTSSGASSTPWYKRLGDNISSTYNKAKDKIGDTFSQAKDKAKEMVSTVKTSFQQ